MVERDLEHAWLMMACGTLASGGTSKAATENADKVLEAFKSRFRRDDDSEED